MDPIQRLVARYVMNGGSTDVASPGIANVVLPDTEIWLPILNDADGVPCFHDGVRCSTVTLGSVLGAHAALRRVAGQGCGVAAKVAWRTAEGRGGLVAHAAGATALPQLLQTGLAALPALSALPSAGSELVAGDVTVRPAFTTPSAARRVEWDGAGGATWGFAGAARAGDLAGVVEALAPQHGNVLGALAALLQASGGGDGAHRQIDARGLVITVGLRDLRAPRLRAARA